MIGGGPAGCAAAITLASEGRRVLLLHDPQDPSEPRGESLSPAGPALLRALGVWDSFLQDGHLPCHANLAAWGSDALVWRDFLADPRGHAWHVDRARLERRLLERASALGVELVAGRAPRRWLASEEGWTAEEGALRAAAVIDASGRSAVFARSVGARRKVGWEQLAVLAVGHHDRVDQGGPGVLESVPEGFWYAAPVPGQRWMAALFTDANLLEGVGLQEPGAWRTLLARTRHLEARLPGELRWGPPRRLAAGTGILEPLFGPGWVAVGDAALCWDPVSAHGLTLALRTGIDGAKAVVAGLAGEAGEAYAARLGRAHERFVGEVRGLWGQERRWEGAPYWARRHGLGVEG